MNAAPLIVRRSLLLELGGLHRELSCAGEAGIGYDFELSVRMWAEGYQVGSLSPRSPYNLAVAILVQYLNL